MTLDEWLESLPDDKRETLCITDAWRAGSKAMLDALIDIGFIDDNYADDARIAVRDVIGG